MKSPFSREYDFLMFINNGFIRLLPKSAGSLISYRRVHI